MPKRHAVGTSLGLYVRRNKRGKGRARSVVEPLEDRLLLSRTWIVAPWGNDGSAGTVAGPFRTIQRAANLANWGDTVLIRGGTYRETVHPTHSGVTFEPYHNENVTVSGADVVSGFWDYRGGIYAARMNWTLGGGNDQLFVDGKMINEARWPNTGPDLSHPTLEYAPRIANSGNRATIYDPRLSGGWQGATIHFNPGQQWYAQTGTVIASGAGWLTFTYTPDGGYMVPGSGTPYYLTGKFQGLDSPGEWYRDGSGQLYVWSPGNSNPAAHVIEAKHRLYAFDLSGVSNTTIEGIHIFAATIASNASSHNTVIDRLTANYISQFLWQSRGWSQPWNSGIELNGANSTLSNSTIAWSAGDGVYVNAPGSKVIGNVIHDVDYNAGDSAAVRDFAYNVTISNNTVYNAGRCGIIMRAGGVQVSGNVIHDAMLQTCDGGGIYTISQNGGGSQIAYNTIYNVRAGGYGANGIMLDNNCSNFNIHDNRIWNTNRAILLNYSSVGHRIYNNQLQGSIGSVAGNGKYNWRGTSIYGNVLFSPIHWPGSGAAIYNNRSSSGSPMPGPIPSLPSSTPSPAAQPQQPASSPSPAPKPAPPPAQGASALNVRQAEAWSADRGLQVKYNALGYADNGDWAEYKNVDFGKGVHTFSASIAVSAQYAGQQIQLRLDGPSGALFGTLRPASTGSFSHFVMQSTSVYKVTGVHSLYLVFAGRYGVANIDWFKFA